MKTPSPDAASRWINSLGFRTAGMDPCSAPNIVQPGNVWTWILLGWQQLHNRAVSLRWSSAVCTWAGPGSNDSGSSGTHV